LLEPRAQLVDQLVRRGLGRRGGGVGHDCSWKSAPRDEVAAHGVVGSVEGAAWIDARTRATTSSHAARSTGLRSSTATALAPSESMVIRRAKVSASSEVSTVPLSC